MFTLQRNKSCVNREEQHSGQLAALVVTKYGFNTQLEHIHQAGCPRLQVIHYLDSSAWNSIISWPGIKTTPNLYAASLHKN